MAQTELIAEEVLTTVQEQPLQPHDLNYIETLVAEAPGTIEFETGAGHIYFDLVKQLPSFSGAEKQKEEVCHMIEEAVYPLASHFLARAVSFVITISPEELTPPQKVSEYATFLAFDTSDKILRSVLIAPHHDMPRDEMTIPSGMTVCCVPMVYNYHKLSDGRGITEYGDTSLLPNQLDENRNKDSGRKPPPRLQWESGTAPGGLVRVGALPTVSAAGVVGMAAVTTGAVLAAGKAAAVPDTRQAAVRTFELEQTPDLSQPEISVPSQVEVRAAELATAEAASATEVTPTLLAEAAHAELARQPVLDEARNVTEPMPESVLAQQQAGLTPTETPIEPVEPLATLAAAAAEAQPEAGLAATFVATQATPSEIAGETATPFIANENAVLAAEAVATETLIAAEALSASAPSEALAPEQAGMSDETAAAYAAVGADAPYNPTGDDYSAGAAVAGAEQQPDLSVANPELMAGGGAGDAAREAYERMHEMFHSRHHEESPRHAENRERFAEEHREGGEPSRPAEQIAARDESTSRNDERPTQEAAAHERGLSPFETLEVAELATSASDRGGHREEPRNDFMHSESRSRFEPEEPFRNGEGRSMHAGRESSDPMHEFQRTREIEENYERFAENGEGQRGWQNADMRTFNHDRGQRVVENVRPAHPTPEHKKEDVVQAEGSKHDRREARPETVAANEVKVEAPPINSADIVRDGSLLVGEAYAAQPKEATLAQNELPPAVEPVRFIEPVTQSDLAPKETLKGALLRSVAPVFFPEMLLASALPMPAPEDRDGADKMIPSAPLQPQDKDYWMQKLKIIRQPPRRFEPKVLPGLPRAPAESNDLVKLALGITTRPKLDPSHPELLPELVPQEEA